MEIHRLEGNSESGLVARGKFAKSNVKCFAHWYFHTGSRTRLALV